MLIVAEFPDERAAMKTVIRAASRGTATSKTLTAIPIKEFYALVDEALTPTAPWGRPLLPGRDDTNFR